VVTYFDEGVLRGIAPGAEGLAVFNDRGQLRGGYRSMFGSKAVDVLDCYAACWASDSRITFLPYTTFPLVTFDLKTFDHNVDATPRIVHGSSAIAVLENEVLFFSPYDKKNAILKWAPGRPPSFIGLYPGQLRGIKGGRFLSHGTSGFTIVEREASTVRADPGQPDA